MSTHDKLAISKHHHGFALRIGPLYSSPSRDQVTSIYAYICKNLAVAVICAAVRLTVGVFIRL